MYLLKMQLRFQNNIFLTKNEIDVNFVFISFIIENFSAATIKT